MADYVNQSPEQIARDNIDKQLHAAGWAVQDKAKIDWTESVGVAVREYQTCGTCGLRIICRPENSRYFRGEKRR